MLVSTHMLKKKSKGVNTHRHFYKYKNIGNTRVLQYYLFEMYLKYNSLLFFYAGSYRQEVKLLFQSTPVHFHVPCVFVVAYWRLVPDPTSTVTTGLEIPWGVELQLPSFPEVFRPQTHQACSHREYLPGRGDDGSGHIFTSTPPPSLKSSSHCWDLGNRHRKWPCCSLIRKPWVQGSAPQHNHICGVLWFTTEPPKGRKCRSQRSHAK